MGRRPMPRLGGLRRPARRILGSDIAGVSTRSGRASPGFDRVTRSTATTSPSREVSRNMRLHRSRRWRRNRPGSTFVEASTIPQAGAIALQGTRCGRGGQPGVDQRCGRWVRFLRHPAVHASRRPCHRRRQRRQAGVHANGRCGRRDRLPPGGLHPHHAALRPDPRPGRAPVGVRLPACAFSRWQVSVRGRFGAHPAPGAHGRRGGRPTHRPIDRCSRGEGRSRPFRAAGRLVRRPGRCKIHIDRVFALDEVAAALAHVGEGRALGKVVVGIG